MRARHAIVSGAIVLAAAAARAQEPPALSPLQLTMACAQPLTAAPPKSGALYIVGTQSPERRTIFSERDLLVISGGTGAGLSVGQEFVVRRPIMSGAAYADRGRAVITSGVIRVVSLNASNAIATVEHACGAILQADYLEPFAAPVIPGGADRDQPTGELDFNAPARVVSGPENHRTAAYGEIVLVDHGAQQGLTPGARVAIFRNLAGSGLPLAAVGEAVVMSAGPQTSLVRITQSRDAVESGDYVVSRR